MLAHHVAVQKRGRTAAHFHQLDHQRVGDGRFARAGKAGEKDGEALFRPRRRGAAQFLHHFGEGEPVGNVQPFAQATAKFGAGDIQNRGPLGHFIDGEILCFFLELLFLFLQEGINLLS